MTSGKRSQLGRRPGVMSDAWSVEPERETWMRHHALFAFFFPFASDRIHLAWNFPVGSIRFSGFSDINRVLRFSPNPVSEHFQPPMKPCLIHPSAVALVPTLVPHVTWSLVIANLSCGFYSFASSEFSVWIEWFNMQTCRVQTFHWASFQGSTML